MHILFNVLLHEILSFKNYPCLTLFCSNAIPYVLLHHITQACISVHVLTVHDALSFTFHFHLHTIQSFIYRYSQITIIYHLCNHNENNVMQLKCKTKIHIAACHELRHQKVNVTRSRLFTNVDNMCIYMYNLQQQLYVFLCLFSCFSI